MTDHIIGDWSERFGLAVVPLFESEETGVPGEHAVMLDGGFGSFALSVSDEQIWREPDAAGWAWSSNLPHHVTVTPKQVAVVRWDKASPELLTPNSVESHLDAFYQYLVSDRVRSNQRVVDHMLSLFRRVRSLVADAQIEDDRSIDAFLAFLDQTVAKARTAAPVGGAVAYDGDVLRALSASGLEALTNEVNADSSLMRSLTLFPTLAVRHAGSEIFQEAHFEFLRAPGLDLFGYVGPAETRAVTRGGAHFTPPALARTLVEQTLDQIPDLEQRDQLTVLDPACGSGAFLHEALRTLRRRGFKGKLHLIGRDISRAAVSMADFVLRNARSDWQPAGKCTVDLVVADALEDGIPAADVILMNPPFMSWAALDGHKREQVKRILGERLEGRGDLSMAFVTAALERLTPGGALGALFPASLLNLQAADAWRKDLLTRADLRFIASLGDFGLFAHALVQIAAAVFKKLGPNEATEPHTAALVTANNAEATGNALRGLRRAHAGQSAVSQGDDWRLFPVSKLQFVDRPVWRLTSPRTERALRRLEEAGAARIGDMFAVRQGVRTGLNSVFVLSSEELASLPQNERRWFRPAVMNEAINAGRLERRFAVFYPYDEAGLALASEEALAREVGTYFKQSLLPEKPRLMARANITRANRQDWWGLSERRSSWSMETGPRIVSKYFGGSGGFATDSEGEFVVVQGFAWFPKWEETFDPARPETADIPQELLLQAYSALMNSRNFGRLLELFSPNVAGGQFDLSPRYVDAVPVPNLIEMAQDERASHIVSALSSLGRDPRLADPEWRVHADRLTAEAYGGDFFDQV